MLYVLFLLAVSLHYCLHAKYFHSDHQKTECLHDIYNEPPEKVKVKMFLIPI